MTTDDRPGLGFVGLLLAAIGLALVGIGDPVGAQTPDRFTEIGTGEFLSCGLLEDGSGQTEVRCWGERRGSTPVSVPTVVPGLAGARSISVGLNHACAVLADGTVSCWGSNTIGQLGDGTRTTRFDPAPVVGLTDVTEVSAGRTHTCALRADGTVSCWGTNNRGQLGIEDNGTQLSPVEVSGLTDVDAIDLGWEHSCAVRTDGTAWCWGNNANGQLGDDQPSRFTPTPVPGLAGIAAVSSGRDHTCALRAAGTIACWGDNESGRLGDGTFEPRTTVVEVVGIADAVDIGTGTTHSCAVLSSGGARCWGENQFSLLGDDTREDRATPVDVIALSDATSIDAGWKHTCAVLASGGASCWGANNAGELGTGDEIDRSLPSPVVLQSGQTSIGGRVATTEGPAVEGVSIDLFTEGRATYLRSTRSAADGTFIFDVDAGCYVLTFLAPTDTVFDGGGLFRNLDLCVTDGQMITDADATLVDGRDPTVSFTGQIGLDGTGPFDGVVVDLFTSDADGNRIAYLGSDTSGPDVDEPAGTYGFDDLQAGCYTLTFIAPPGTLLRDPVTGNGTPFRNVTRCPEPGTAARVDVRLTGTPDQGRIEVDVTDQAGLGVAGVAVDLFQAAADGSRSSFIRSATTTTDGTAAFDVTPGCYVLVAIAPDGQAFTNGSRWSQAGRCVDGGQTIDDLAAVLG